MTQNLFFRVSRHRHKSARRKPNDIGRDISIYATKFTSGFTCTLPFACIYQRAIRQGSICDNECVAQSCEGARQVGLRLGHLHTIPTFFMSASLRHSARRKYQMELISYIATPRAPRAPILIGCHIDCSNHTRRVLTTLTAPYNVFKKILTRKTTITARIPPKFRRQPLFTRSYHLQPRMAPRDQRCCHAFRACFPDGTSQY